MAPGKFHGWPGLIPGPGYKMTISQPSSRPAGPASLQPWAAGLAGVVAILALLVVITL
jgi:hypothetical protein